jgi:tetratricopeptide (TPR) repeat protein
MSQRLLIANQQRLDAAREPLERVRLLQDRIVLLSRLGRADAARELLQPLEHVTPADAPAALRLRSEYAAAIRLYFAKRFDEARSALLNVVERARHDVPDLALVGECESALALFMQREGDVRAAARCARGVLTNPAATLESRYRALLALGSLHQDAYAYDDASRYYAEAEGVVRELGDDIAMASWLQRSALTQAAHARQAAALGELDGAALAAAVAGLRRSIDFAAGFAEGPDTTLDHLLLAEMHVLQQRHAEAVALYESHLPTADGEGFLHEVTAAMADHGLCLLQLGRGVDGLARVQAALARVDESTPADIRAIVHGNMAAALAQLGRGVEGEQHRVMADMAWDTYAHEQREARRLLSGEPTETLH